MTKELSFQEFIEQDVLRSVSGRECNKYDAKNDDNLHTWAKYIQNRKETESMDVFTVSDKKTDVAEVCLQCGEAKEQRQAQDSWRCYRGFVSKKIRDFFLNQK